MTTGPGDEPEAPLGRLLEIAAPAAGRLVLATLLGAVAVAAGIGLIATSAWLISRSAQRPPESAIAVAIVGVQFFALSRGLFRYGERLVGHDAAFGMLAVLRVRVYERLERLAPLGLPAFRSGDLLARLVGDVDSLQDLLLRVVPPFVIAVVVGAATVALVWWILPAAGLILLAALALAGMLVPWLTGILAARTEVRQAPARGELSAAVVDLLDGAQELIVSGAADAQLARTAAADAELTQVAGAAARTAGIGQGLTTLCLGLAMWGAVVVGISAERAEHLNGVLLAVIALIPLAAFELVAGLPGATQTLQRVRRSATRVLEVIDSPPVVPEPLLPASPGPPPHALRVRGLRVRYPDRGRWALDGVDLDLGPGRRIAVVGPSGGGKSTLAGALLRFLPYQGGSVTLDGVEISELDGDQYRRVIGLVAQDAHIFDNTLEENLRLAHRDATENQLLAALDQVRLLDWALTKAAGGSGDRGRRAWRAHVRRPATAPRRGSRPPRRLSRAGARRARRAPGHVDRRRHRRRPARRHAGPDDPADHAPVGRSGADRRGARARRRPGGRARDTRRAGGRRWPLCAHVGA
jgi:thiol reductant ABC exporter CydC subunit